MKKKLYFLVEKSVKMKESIRHKKKLMVTFLQTFDGVCHRVFCFKLINTSSFVYFQLFSFIFINFHFVLFFLTFFSSGCVRISQCNLQHVFLFFINNIARMFALATLNCSFVLKFSSLKKSTTLPSLGNSTTFGYIGIFLGYFFIFAFSVV